MSETRVADKRKCEPAWWNCFFSHYWPSLIIFITLLTITDYFSHIIDHHWSFFSHYWPSLIIFSNYWPSLIIFLTLLTITDYFSHIIDHHWLFFSHYWPSLIIFITLFRQIIRYFCQTWQWQPMKKICYSYPRYKTIIEYRENYEYSSLYFEAITSSMFF